jgi:hypothetical protein
MLSIRQWKRFVAWLALAATLAAALLPSIAHALSSDRVENIMRAEICAPSGMRYDMAAGEDGKAPGKQAGHMDDCPYCRLPADIPVLPGTELAFAPSPTATALPFLFYHAPTPLFTWAAAKPRGPPFHA